MPWGCQIIPAKTGHFERLFQQIIFRIFVIYFIENHLVILFTINLSAMKKIIVIFFLFLTTGMCVFAQVGINDNNSSPDASAGLDVNFNNKGLLPPRMTFEQRNAIQNPVEGLIVYCTNCNSDATGLLCIYQGGKWRNISFGCTTPIAPPGGTHISEVTQITWNWNTVPIALGYKWNTSDNYNTATDMGNAITKKETGLTCQTNYTRYVWAYNDCGQSFALSTTQATQQVPLANSPLPGTHEASDIKIIWNWNPVTDATGYKWSATDNFSAATDMGTLTTETETGLTCNTGYTRYVWAYTACGNSATTILTQTTTINPDAPTAGTHFPSTTLINWNWNSVPGATGYKWNYKNVYSSATDMGTATTTTQTDLACATAYTAYVWAYNSCGYSSPVALTSSTTACCGTSLTISHTAGEVAPVTKTVNYSIVTNIPGEPAKCWIASNLGSDHQAISKDDATEASAGWYWQFNRKQGYKHDGSTFTPAWTITSINENSDWTLSNDPCAIELGGSWRIPTLTEWTNVDNAGSWTTWNGPWNSDMKLHAAGYIIDLGALFFRGSRGRYWSSTQTTPAYAYFLNFDNVSSGPMYTFYKADGYSLRCLRH
jgi:hypothetical protein